MSITVSPEDRLGAHDAGPAVPAPPRGKNFSVFVSRATLFWMLCRFAFLTLITLGIYRFWAKTKLRRYLWSTVEYDGDRFEYHGTAKELFLGFLIALAVLLPLGIGDTILKTMVFAEGDYPALAGLYAFVFLFVVMFLFQFALYRMRRYQLTRTSWRSVHFGLDGSAAGFALHSVLWLALVGFTGGLAYPWMQAWQTRRIVDNARVGNLSFSNTVSGWDIFKRYILFYLVMMVALVVGSVMMVNMVESGGTEIGVGAVLFFVSAFGFLAVGSVILRLSIFRLSINHTRLGGNAIRADFSAGPIIWSGLLSIIVAIVIYFALSALAVVLAYLVIGGGAMGLSGMGLDDQAIEQFTQYGPFAFAPAIILAGLLAGAAGMAIFGVTVMRTIIPGIELEHSEELDQILQSENTGPKYGEGFADALDVGAF